MYAREIFKAKILIVDDQKLHVGLLEDILRKAGYQNIYTTTEPQKAIEIYQEIRPDLVLLDLVMPKMDGFAVMEKLASFEPNERLPILALSPEKGQEACIRALEAGATDFLRQPYETIEVLVRCHNIIEATLLHNQVKDQNKILEDKVRDRTKELRETRLDIIRRLARAAEYRDEDTGAHIIRMSRLCAKLGEAAGLDPRECDLLLNASPLHDIGKLGIPDSVLLKPGKLDPAEWEIMKTHTSIGQELLSGSDSELMRLAETIALSHHERWDGKGYPQGLKGEAIPLVGRITAICDVFDALMSRRPYKKAWSYEESVEEIKKQVGTQFDPQLVDKFLKILPSKEVLEKEYDSDREP